MRPNPIRPVKHFWKVGSRECVQYVIDGRIEVRLIEDSTVTNVAVCRDAVQAEETARRWLARPAVAIAHTPCPRCKALETRPSNHTEGFVYLRCNACREVWRMPERRARERVAAERASARRHATPST
jgi:hypothetical protein